MFHILVPDRRHGTLKFNDFPPEYLAFDMMPKQMQNYESTLPFDEYMTRAGKYNIFRFVPPTVYRPDYGPMLFTGYGSLDPSHTGATPLHIDFTESVNIMFSATTPEDDDGAEENSVRAYLREHVSCAATLRSIYAHFIWLPLHMKL